MTEEFYSVDFVDGEDGSTDVSDYWDAVQGSFSLVPTTDLEGSNAFTAGFSENSYGELASPVTDNRNTAIEMMIDPNSERIYTEHWILNFSRLSADATLK